MRSEAWFDKQYLLTKYNYILELAATATAARTIRSFELIKMNVLTSYRQGLLPPDTKNILSQK